MKQISCCSKMRTTDRHRRPWHGHNNINSIPTSNWQRRHLPGSNIWNKPSMVMQSCIPQTEKPKAGGLLWVQGLPGIHRILCLKSKQTKNWNKTTIATSRALLRSEFLVSKGLSFATESVYCSWFQGQTENHQLKSQVLLSSRFRFYTSTTGKFPNHSEP